LRLTSARYRCAHIKNLVARQQYISTAVHCIGHDPGTSARSKERSTHRLHAFTVLVLLLWLERREYSMTSWDRSSPEMWDAEWLRMAIDAAGIALWSWNVDTDAIAMDERAHALWRVPKGGQVTFAELSAHIHREDLHRVKAAFEARRAVLGTYEIDFRVGDAADARWISARGQGDDKGMVDRIMFGIFLDVTERRQAEEAHEMIAGEMSHRVKNLFAIASALTAIASRSTATTTEMAHDLTQRLTALGRAHDLVRPIPGQDAKTAALLGDLLTVLLAPYNDNGGVGAGRIHVSGPEICVGESAATTLALVVHELATNSIKYGALSAASGTLDVSCTAQNGDAVIVWTERGGPPVGAPTGRAGFGSKLVNQSISGQLGGSITFDWLPAGAVVTLRMSKARLAI